MLKFDWNMLWTLIDLIIFFVLMKCFLFKPIKKTLDARKELIDNQFKEAEDKEKSALELKAEVESQLESVEEEKKKIIVEARENAKTEYDRIVDRAQSDADRIKADAKRSAELESEKILMSVREDVAALAMAATEKVLGESASKDIDSDLYNKFLDESSEN